MFIFLIYSEKNYNIYDILIFIKIYIFKVCSLNLSSIFIHRNNFKGVFSNNFKFVSLSFKNIYRINTFPNYQLLIF